MIDSRQVESRSVRVSAPLHDFTEHIDRYAARLPERRHLDGRCNGERLAAAQTRIDARHAAIPHHSEARQSSASLSLARGWTRQRDEMLRRRIGSDPINPALHADLAENLLTLQHWPAARAALDCATVLDAENGAVRWKPDDHWTVYGATESVTNQIPLRAVADGIHANRVGAGAEWRQHESRKLGVGVYASDFSDGNLRTGANAACFERWASGPHWTIETTPGVDASHNSLDTSVNCFNPKSDRSLWLGAAVENLTWRSHDHSFRQRLALTGGSNWQEFYGSGAVEAIEYTHRWELDRDLSLRYGIGRLLRPYDGEREGRTFGNLVLLWRF